MGGLTSKGWEPGKMGQNFARLHNIFQQEKHTEVGTVMEGLCGDRECMVQEAGSSHPPVPLPFSGLGWEALHNLKEVPVS